MIFDNIKLQISNFKLNIFGILHFQVGNIESKFLSALSVALYTFITVLIYLHFITNYVAILATERKEYNYKCSQCTLCLLVSRIETMYSRWNINFGLVKHCLIASWFIKRHDTQTSLFKYTHAGNVIHVLKREKIRSPLGRYIFTAKSSRFLTRWPQSSQYSTQLAMTRTGSIPVALKTMKLVLSDWARPFPWNHPFPSLPSHSLLLPFPLFTFSHESVTEARTKMLMTLSRVTSCCGDKTIVRIETTVSVRTMKFDECRALLRSGRSLRFCE